MECRACSIALFKPRVLNSSKKTIRFHCAGTHSTGDYGSCIIIFKKIKHQNAAPNNGSLWMHWLIYGEMRIFRSPDVTILYVNITYEVKICASSEKMIQPNLRNVNVLNVLSISGGRLMAMSTPKDRFKNLFFSFVRRLLRESRQDLYFFKI